LGCARSRKKSCLKSCEGHGARYLRVCLRGVCSRATTFVGESLTLITMAGSGARKRRNSLNKRSLKMVMHGKKLRSHSITNLRVMTSSTGSAAPLRTLRTSGSRWVAIMREPETKALGVLKRPFNCLNSYNWPLSKN
jgi:hypothetical protein